MMLNPGKELLIPPGEQTQGNNEFDSLEGLLDLKGFGDDEFENAFIDNGSGMAGFGLTDLLLSGNNPLKEKDANFDYTSCLQHQNLWDQIPPCGLPMPYQSNDNVSISDTAGFDASSVINSFDFAQFEPNGGKEFQNSQLSEVLDYSVDNFTHKNDKQENLVPFADGLLESIVESTSASISVFPKENESENAIEHDFDLNKTPPRLKTSKRRKHKPKVIIEGKLKKTPENPKKTNPRQNSQGKRKYVRRNAGLKNTNPQEKPRGKRKYVWRNGNPRKPQQGVSVETTPESLGVRKESCRKALNFDLKETCDDGKGKVMDSNASMHQININCNLNSSVQDIESFTGTSSISGNNSGVQISQGNEKIVKMSQENIKRSVDKIQTQYTSQFPIHGAKIPQATVKGVHMNNFVASYNGNAAQSENAGSNNGNVGNSYTPRHQHINALLQRNNIHGNSERNRQLMVQNIQHLRVDGSGHGRHTRETIEQVHPRTNNMMNPPYLIQEMLGKRSADGMNDDMGFSETRKKMKGASGVITDMSFRYSYPSNGDGLNHFKSTGNSIKKTAAQAKMMGLNQISLCDVNDVKSNDYPTQINQRNMTASMRNNNDQNRNNGIQKFISDMYIQSIMARLQRQQSSSQPHFNKGKEERIPNGYTQYYNPQAMTKNSNKFPACPTQTTTRSNYGKVIGMNHLNFSPKQMVPSSLNAKRIMPCKYSSNEQFIQTTGPPENKKNRISVVEIIRKLKDLNLNCKRIEKEVNGGNAIVPYKGEGSIVPYQEYLKKRLPRPKVDLDEETTRVWKLLMEEGSDDNEEMNKDTEKYWERERAVFCGRADSFIARMHLVQGDRRFSRWKGSVVDSVIGVFLTQNVSDHLSSSAFMSLASHFPFQPTGNNMDITPFRDQSNLKVEGWLSNVQRNNTVNWSGKLPYQLTYHHSSTRMQESGAQNEDGTIPIIGENILEAQNLLADEEAISSHDSFDPTIINITGTIRSSSGSNSEAEDSTSVHKHNQTETSCSIQLQHNRRIENAREFYIHDNGNPLFYESYTQGHKQSGKVDSYMQKTISERVDNIKSSLDLELQEHKPYPVASTPTETPHLRNQWLHMTPDSGLQEVSHSNTWGEEINSSWISTATGGTTEKEVYCLNRGGEMEEHIGMTRNQHTVQKNGYLGSEQPPGGVVLSNKYPVHHEHFLLNNAMQKIPDVTKPAEENHFDGRLHSLSPDNACSTTETILKVNKAKADSNAKSTQDWEALRRQVHTNYTKTEKSRDSMDILDYESMRNARVDEISAIIRERGMNNLLAERIMNFLHRLVKDHGNVDLEWLKDAPPDKAKEFLLSIRGLGLKSVECVRLLTLHHLAFPVDTNVGRIAVRLGWVPLQPLPESLQLHLLELYPVLESIQKYLWPRLCKMDQRSLYELHYQMITFGKVFCTKSKPNCNSCPMRAECRHFASAFASARLALPGPEEKSIVNPLVYTTASNKKTVFMNHLPLPSTEKDDLSRVQEAVGKCEPIIEIPVTPEPESTDVWDSDIEDSFYEEPEIPTIQLNIEEFTTNLQAYMVERKMEVQESNMSKAVVAIHPSAASIPTPKLKNVSRLRTEHQVYELPDLHPCLNDMDKREPDDPSPYLLAIWTPGETVNSIQQPETRCESQELGKLCNEDTCYSCNSIRESNLQTVRGTILIPCRTAMRGSFPLNGTYFQVNEVFADHHSSLSPIDVPRAWIWNLTRRTVFFGTSVSTIFRGLTTEEIQYCFWRGFVCVRGFDQTRRAPRPLIARLHFPVSKLQKQKTDKQGRKL